jgi:Flp pilus assembly protein TadD
MKHAVIAVLIFIGVNLNPLENLVFSAAAGQGISENQAESGPSQQSESAAQKLLAAGWDNYNAGNFDQARSLFALAEKSDHPDVRGEARLGLAYTLQKQNQFEEAYDITRELAAANYQPDKTRPLLMELLLSTSRLDEAKALLEQMPKAEFDIFQGRLTTAETDRAMPTLRLELDTAWKALNTKDYERARDLFDNVAEHSLSEMNRNARLGLAYAYGNLGDQAKAESLLKALLLDDYPPDEVAAALIELALAEGDVEQAKEYLSRLTKDKQKEWAARIDQADKKSREEKYVRIIGQAWNRYNAQAFDEAFHLFSSAMAQSSRHKDASFGRALAAWRSGRLDTARSELNSLLSSGYQPEQTLPALIGVLLDQNDLEAAEAYLKRASTKKTHSPDYRARLRDLKTAWIGKKLETLESGTPEHIKTAKELRARLPGDKGLLSTLAWSCYAAGDYDCALQHFSVLRDQDPDDSSAVLGLGYTLQALNRPDEALALLKNHSGPDDPKLTELKVNLYQVVGQNQFDNGEFSLSEATARQGLAIDPEHHGLWELLGWSLYEQDKTEEALEIFQKIFNKDRTSEAAQSVITTLDKSGDQPSLWSFISDLTESDRSELKKIAAQRYDREGWSLLAAQTWNDPETCQYNCDAVTLMAGPGMIHKDGDSGLSRLTRYTAPLKMDIPFSDGRRLMIDLTTEYLDAGSATPAVYAGSYYRYLDNPNRAVNDFEGSAMVLRPSVGLAKEGPWSYYFQLGTTPIHGPVSPLPEFVVEVTRHQNFTLRAHECAVEDSFLSLVGQKDPYSGRTWGRMVRTGMTAEKTMPLPPPYWMTVSGGLDYIWGENAADNYNYRASLSIGRTDPLSEWLFSYGMFGLVEHYDRNADFYTFGHGGYFSPSVFFLAGPFLRFQSPTCRDFRLDLQASLGYMYYQTENAPHYHGIDDDPALLDAAAGIDLLGDYEGETQSGLGLNLSLTGLKQISRYLAVGGRVAADTSSNHFRWSGNLFLQLSLKPWNRICQGFGTDTCR